MESTQSHSRETASRSTRVTRAPGCGMDGSGAALRQIVPRLLGLETGKHLCGVWGLTPQGFWDRSFRNSINLLSASATATRLGGHGLLQLRLRLRLGGRCAVSAARLEVCAPSPAGRRTASTEPAPLPVSVRPHRTARAHGAGLLIVTKGLKPGLHEPGGDSGVTHARIPHGD